MPAVRASAITAPDRPDRKSAILLAAEKLFAQHGYDVVSLRQIAEAAGVPLALVNYYYGQKHELFQAVFAHWQETIDQRLSGLRQALAAPPRERLGRIVEAFIGPVLRLRASAEGEYYALLMAREVFNPRPHSDPVLRDMFDPLARAFMDGMGQALPHARAADIAWCYQFMLGALINHICDERVLRLSEGRCLPADPDAGDLLARFITGGLQAALPPPAKGSTKTRRQP